MVERKIAEKGSAPKYLANSTKKSLSRLRSSQRARKQLNSSDLFSRNPSCSKVFPRRIFTLSSTLCRRRSAGLKRRSSRRDKLVTCFTSLDRVNTSAPKSSMERRLTSRLTKLENFLESFHLCIMPRELRPSNARNQEPSLPSIDSPS